MPPSLAMQSFAARLHTFTSPQQQQQHQHHANKRRRASSSASGKREKKSAPNTAQWPHERPGAEEMARAGFFYSPHAPESEDNAQCFLCAVKLDGWEQSDVPLAEHVAHSSQCAWAVSVSAAQAGDECDPISDELATARRGTFEHGAGWPHEGKRGWKCTVTRMIDAGWVFDPSVQWDLTEAERDREGLGDGVTCFYCNLSLDGWEPKDDPRVEHARRSPHCAFFALCERYGHGAESGKKAKATGGRKVRGSTASKASRLSTQSSASRVEERASLHDVGATSEVGGGDDSIVSTATTASQATASGASKGGKRNVGRKAATTKGAKGKKRVDTVKPQGEDAGPEEPPIEHAESRNVLPAVEDLVPDKPIRATRRGTRQSKQIDSSVVEISTMEVAAALTKNTVRSRKAKASTQSQTQSQLQKEPHSSEVSAQLQEELEHSLDFHDPDAEATPQAEPTKPQRGVKRTSDGMMKTSQHQQRSSVAVVEFPVPPSQPAKKKAAAKKGKAGERSRNTPCAQVVCAAVDDELAKTQQDASLVDFLWMDAQTSGAPAAASKADFEPAKKGGRLRKGSKTAMATVSKKGERGKASSMQASTTRSSEVRDVLKVTVEASGDGRADDLERDEREIELELQRMAAEQASAGNAVQAEHEKAEEFENTPSHAQQIRLLEQELAKEAERLPQPSTAMANWAATVTASPLPAPQQDGRAEVSPAGSDKENIPSSTVQPSAQKPPQALQSPTQAMTRIPLAPGTPHHSHPYPSNKQRAPLSPSKHLSHLASTVPWTAMDLDTILLRSPQPTPVTLSQRLVGAAGGLESPEKDMTVEQWVKHRAEKGEEELRRRCEGLVGVLERESVRAMASLDGIVVS